ncbi:MAG: hypothetical protein II433_09925 [Acidaminococcaceae bacterium]|nr:hypothetical protein [Acidaminococcaceae bacterium]
MPTNVTNEAESNLIKKAQMAKVREVDFTRRFTGTILRKLMEALGVTRKIPMIDGTTMYYYTTTGTLQSGLVGEGEIIPLSQYQRNKVAIGEITLKKWRKAASAEAILKSGYNEAVRETDKKLMLDVQTGIRTDFFNFLKGVDGTVVADTTLQKVIAKTWGNMQVLFENDAVQVVHFIHPLTVADYLGTATVSMQTAFGFNYIEDFLGMGTVILSSQIPQGQVYTTAKENLILYYVPVSSEALSAFGLTADETGFVGIKSGYPNEERAQVESLVMSGIQILVEYANGVVIGQVDSTPTLGSVTVSSGAGTASGDTAITVSGYSLGTGESWVYKVGTTAPSVTYGQNLSSWTAWNGTDDITAATGKKITVAAVDANKRAQAAGNTTVTAHA